MGTYNNSIVEIFCTQTSKWLFLNYDNAFPVRECDWESKG